LLLLLQHPELTFTVNTKKWLPSSRGAVAVGGLVGQRQSEDVVLRSACNQRMMYWEVLSLLHHVTQT